METNKHTHTKTLIKSIIIIIITHTHTHTHTHKVRKSLHAMRATTASNRVPAVRSSWVTLYTSLT